METLLAAPLKLVPPDAKASARIRAEFLCHRDIAILGNDLFLWFAYHEVCGLLASDMDWNERLVRVRGKGKKGAVGSDRGNRVARHQSHWSLLANPPGGESPVFLCGPRKLRPISPRDLQLRLKKYLALAGLDSRAVAAQTAAIVTRPTCWMRAPICAACRKLLGHAHLSLLRFILTSPRNGSSARMTRRTRGLETFGA